MRSLHSGGKNGRTGGPGGMGPVDGGAIGAGSTIIGSGSNMGSKIIP